MKKIIVIFFLLVASRPCFGEVYSTKEKVLAEIFQDSEEIEAIKVTLTEYQRDAIENKLGRRLPEEDFIFYIGKTKEKIDGYSLVLHEMGKHGPITFLINIDIEGKIKNLAVLESKEVKGAKIRKKRFLRQFLGKSLKDPLRLRKDIDAVTGATISSNTATLAVRKALIIWEEVF